MTNYYIQSMDPSEMSSRFSNEEAVTPFEDNFDFEWKEEHLDRIRLYLPRLPDREADLIDLYFFLNKKQTEIAQIFELTQAAVSYRLKRALGRLRFLMEMPDLSADQIREDLSPILSDLDVQIFQQMYITTCQSEVANRLSISQGKVRHRFLGALHLIALHALRDVLNSDTIFQEDIQIVRSLYDHRDLPHDAFCAIVTDLISKWHSQIEKDPDAYTVEFRKIVLYFWAFQRVRKNFNILREVKLPKWHGRATRTLA